MPINIAGGKKSYKNKNNRSLTKIHRKGEKQY
jgi:hypothetical protein